MKSKSKPNANTLDRLNSGPVTFSGSSDALYQRHLTFDQVVPVAAATPRVKFEAIARSVRDLLSQRWITTEQTYQTRNVKRVYYLSLERKGDHYLHLADLRSYSDAHTLLGELYADKEKWSRKAALNIAASGTFSSDRTIADYARDIWQVKPCLVGLK